MELIRIDLIPNSKIHELSEVLLDATQWMNRNDSIELNGQWNPEGLTEKNLLKDYGNDEIYIAYQASNSSSNNLVGGVVIQQLDPVYWPEETGDDSAYLHKLAIMSDYHGRGIAEKIVQHVIARSRELGKTYLRLDCRANRPKLCQFYERLGFKPVSIFQAGAQQEIRAQLFEMKL